MLAKQQKPIDLNFNTYNPHAIKWCSDFIYWYFNDVDWSKGVYEILLSGAKGSAKSTLAAHLIVRYAIDNPGSKIAICRRTLKSVKKSIYKEIKKQILNSDIEKYLKKTSATNGMSDNTAEIKFINGSEIFPLNWSDGNYQNFRSLEIHVAVFEELTENHRDHKEAYDEIIDRLGRDARYPSFSLSMTNPDEPDHWVYEHFFLNQDPLKKVFYSKTRDNIFLPATYEQNRRKNYTPLMAARMLDGQWVRIASDNIYYNYAPERNFIDKVYEINPQWPIDLSFDFNSATGKPMSCSISQYDKAKDIHHFFNEAVIQGAKTVQILEDIASRGLLDICRVVRIMGDCNGVNRDTRNNSTDYDIILDFLQRYKTKNNTSLSVEYCVMRRNPELKHRHNLVNSYFYNADGVVRLFIYKDAPTCNRGMLLTKYLSGSKLLEDDSFDAQHITTTMGYKIFFDDLGKGTNDRANSGRRR